MPWVLQGEGQWYGDADDRSDRGRSGTVEKGPCSDVAAQAVEVCCSEKHEREGGEKCDRGREQSSPDAGCGEADDCDGLDDRAGRDLTEGDGIEELPRWSSSGSGGPRPPA